MPRIEITLDGDEAFGLLTKSTGSDDTTLLAQYRNYEPGSRHFAAGDMDEVLQKAVRGFARNIFSTGFEIARATMVGELKYNEGDFEKVCRYVHEFDENRLPLNVDIWATDGIAWYDSESAMRSADKDIRLAKQRRIAQRIEEELREIIQTEFGAVWQISVWIHLTGGLYYQTPDYI